MLLYWCPSPIPFILPLPHSSCSTPPPPHTHTRTRAHTHTHTHTHTHAQKKRNPPEKIESNKLPLDTIYYKWQLWCKLGLQISAHIMRDTSLFLQEGHISKPIPSNNLTLDSSDWIQSHWFTAYFSIQPPKSTQSSHLLEDLKSKLRQSQNWPTSSLEHFFFYFFLFKREFSHDKNKNTICTMHFAIKLWV